MNLELRFFDIQYKNSHEEILRMLGSKIHPESAIGTDKRKRTFRDVWALALRKILKRKRCLSCLNASTERNSRPSKNQREKDFWNSLLAKKDDLIGDQWERVNNVCKGEKRGRQFEVRDERWKFRRLLWAKCTLPCRTEKSLLFKVLERTHFYGISGLMVHLLWLFFHGIVAFLRL